MLERLFNIFKSKPAEPDTMKYLVAGLGNIGAEYEGTRHNIGFDVVDLLARELESGFKMDKLGDVAECKYKGRTLVLLKPTTYMNLSGKAVKYWMDKLKIQPENLIVIVDDIHLDLGKMRLRDRGSDGGHNGLRDIQDKLGHTHYYRLRLGIGNNFHAGQQSNFVLGKWKPAEEKAVNEMVTNAVIAVKNFVTIGFKPTVDALNK